jgi:hypothetical protein
LLQLRCFIGCQGNLLLGLGIPLGFCSSAVFSG